MTLLQPRLAQSIEKFAIGGRRVAQQSLVLKKKGRMMNPPISPADENRAIHCFAASLEETMKSANFRWSSMIQILKERGNEYIIEDNDLDTEGCRMFPADTDFMPSQALINRFVRILHNFDFTSLNTIISNELVQHMRVVLKNSSNNIVTSFTARNRGDSMPREPRLLWCDCARDPHHHKCTCFRTMSRFFFQELGRINAGLRSDLWLYKRLRTLDLNLPNHCGVMHTATYDQQRLVRFIRNCTGLQRFRLATRVFDTSGTFGAGPIAWILGRLHQATWKPPLTHLELSCVDPAEVEVITFLGDVASTLNAFHVRNAACHVESTKENGRRFYRLIKMRAQRIRLLQALRAMAWPHGGKGPELYLPNYKYSINPVAARFPDAIIDETASIACIDAAIQTIQHEAQVPVNAITGTGAN